jgi:hypothetical protein
MEKERILQAKREECQVTDKGKPFRITASFSTQTLKVRRPTWEAVIKRITVEGNCGQKVHETTSQPMAEHGT